MCRYAYSVVGGGGSGDGGPVRAARTFGRVDARKVRPKRDDRDAVVKL